ncbi:hypothetical protein ACFYY1_42650 [Streptomyces sp. NPDC001890]|uniref:hypothetical protein n=1 Tax=Streptomyces sp. NPDC001890 TaxID=3364620 RepID=UPI003676BAB5
MATFGNVTISDDDAANNQNQNVEPTGATINGGVYGGENYGIQGGVFGGRIVVHSDDK